ncbi:MAG: GreA/GreB family elongation factor, partial [Lachnospiraceae bacterium]|nr:GreA/GreB family elongation factor [Lachnospiraceae bacterium]
MLHEKLTESDVKKIQEEIEYRKLVIRKEALESVKEARAHGDLSENFEYKAAKQYKNKNEGRIRYLEKLLKNAEVIEDHAEFDEVGLNKLVRIYIPEDDEEEEYKVVTSIRGNSVKGYISIESPLGKSLLGHKVGENVYVRVNETY